MGRGGDPDSALRRMSADHLQDTLRNVIEWDTKRLDVEGQRLDTLKEIAATQEAYDARQLTVATQKMEAARNYLRQQLDEEGYRSEEHTSELQTLMRLSYAVFCLK